MQYNNPLKAENEIVLFKLKKKKWFIPIMIILCPFSLIAALIFLIPCINNMFFGGISFDSNNSYLYSLISLTLFLPIALYLPINYARNKLIITNYRLILSKGTSGVLYTINMSDILAYLHVSTTTKGITSHIICFYLISGKMITTSSLYLYEEEILDLLNVLNNKIRHITSPKELTNQFSNTNCFIDVKRKPFLPIIMYSPFVIALIMLILYVIGFNEIGKQLDIQVYGTVVSKSEEYNDGKIEYNFWIEDKEMNKEYYIPVDQDIYSMFEENDRILIEAKKGSLGIVYEQWIYTQ